MQPLLVRRYLERALPEVATVPRRTRVAQIGEMRLKPGGRWLRFEAVEEFAVEAVAFSWSAQFPIAPLVTLRVVDCYTAGDGRLEGRLWGRLPVVRSRGPETAQAEALRYLAELPWVPHAMRANRELDWREIDDRSVEVSARVANTGVAVRLEFDPAGDIVGAFAERPRLDRGRTVATPWVGTFADFEIVGGVRIPTRGEVRWELPDGLFPYWRGTVTSLETTTA